MDELRESGLDEEALCVGENACGMFPQEFSLRFACDLYLPALYESEGDVLRWHGRFKARLERLTGESVSWNAEIMAAGARGFSRYTNFGLGYLGFENLHLLRQYGQFVHRVMSSAYPQWARALVAPARNKPSVGFVSAFFRQSSVGEHLLGWFTQGDPDAYEVHCYSLGKTEDSVTGDYQRASASFTRCASLEEACEAIRRDQLDILVYTDIGLRGVPSQMAALRLAPIQCATLGHPITTGLPTIDYFISGAGIEPTDGEQHYTETLVRLPNLGVCCRKPIIPLLLFTKPRSDFGLPDDAIVYLCCQSLFKYLPRQDCLIAQIAARVPKARFVFVQGDFVWGNPVLAKKLLARLESAFVSAGIEIRERCHLLPAHSPGEFWNLMRISDVFLDTVAHSGGRTTLQAIACGLPIVTVRGALARQRQSSAMLDRLGVPNLDGARFLGQTLESLERNRPYVRWMLQDAGSNDTSLAIAQKFAGSSDNIAVENDCGQADGLNRAFSRMGGDVIGFLNSDDCLVDGAAEAVLSEFDKDADLDLVYGEVDWIDEDGAITGHHEGRISTLTEVLDIYSVWWNRRQWVQPEVFWRRRLWERVGAFDTRYDLAFDYDYWVRCFLAGAKIKKVTRTLARFRLHSSQKSRSGLQAANEIRNIAGDALKLCEAIPGRRKLERMIRFDRYQSGQDYSDRCSRPGLASMVVRQPDWLLLPSVRKRAYDSVKRRFTNRCQQDVGPIDR